MQWVSGYAFDLQFKFAVDNRFRCKDRFSILAKFFNELDAADNWSWMVPPGLKYLDFAKTLKTDAGMSRATPKCHTCKTSTFNIFKLKPGSIE